MVNLFSQLIGETGTLLTNIYPEGILANTLIKSVRNGLLLVSVEGVDRILSFCDIVGYTGPGLSLIKLDESPKESLKGECACCEEPMRMYLDSLFNSPANFFIDVYSTTCEDYSPLENTKIIRTGEGIAIVDADGFEQLTALSICKIKALGEYVQSPSE